MKIKKIILSFLIFCLIFPFFAEKNFQNHHRMKKYNKMQCQNEAEINLMRGKFELLKLRVAESENEIVVFSFFFNKVLNPDSVKKENIEIDDLKNFDLNPRFSKNGRKFTIFMKNPEYKKNFKVKLKNVESAGGEKISPVNLEIFLENNTLLGE